MSPFRDVRDGVVVYEDRRVVDVKIVAAAADNDDRRHSEFQPERAHPVNKLPAKQNCERCSRDKQPSCSHLYVYFMLYIYVEYRGP